MQKQIGVHASSSPLFRSDIAYKNAMLCVIKLFLMFLIVNIE
jgi:hypothetical protein